MYLFLEFCTKTKTATESKATVPTRATTTTENCLSKEQDKLKLREDQSRQDFGAGVGTKTLRH